MDFRHDIRVRYGETDRMGVVHHSVYPLYFEEARTELMRSLGVCYADLEREGYYLPLTDLEVRFKSPPRYDDVVSVKTAIAELTRVRVVIDYRVERGEEGELLATGRTRHVATSPELRPRRLPKSVVEKLRRGLPEEERPRSRQR